MEKAVKVKAETKSSGLPWLPLLACLTVGFSAGLVTVAIVTYQELNDLDNSDAIMREEIEKLRYKLEDIPLTDALPVSHFEETTDKDEGPGWELRGSEDRGLKTGVKRQAPTPNIFEAILKAQESIFEKYCHKPNATCPNGADGEKGDPGDAGIQGKTGIQGHVGYQGVVGDQGVPGFKGHSGDTGPAGPNGTTGPQGAMGIRGINGDQGPAGAVGNTGQTGAKGSRGPKGETGQRGPTGPSGRPGLKGEKGDPGEQGMRGATGDMGPQGTKGNDTKQLGDGCECVTQPTFSDTPFNSRAHARSAIDALCQATGNPEPDVTVRKLSDTTQTADTYECTASNMFGSVSKYVKIPTKM